MLDILSDLQYRCGIRHQAANESQKKTSFLGPLI